MENQPDDNTFPAMLHCIKGGFAALVQSVESQELAMKPLSGLRFAHASLLCQDSLENGNRQPALCEVIRVADNIVWYAVLDRKGEIVSREWCQAETFPAIFANAA